MTRAAEAVPLTLVSHALCPYVQRAAIVLLEKGVPFTRRDVDLSAKPDWFHAVSPLGKTPVLIVGETALFESAVICEYLDEATANSLHPQDPLERARHRAWMEFGSAALAGVWGYYSAPNAADCAARRDALRARFEQLEAVLHPGGPWFAGSAFGMVDVAFAPVWRYLDAFESRGATGWLDGLDRMQRWRAASAERPSIRHAVSADYQQKLLRFLEDKGAQATRAAPSAAV